MNLPGHLSVQTVMDVQRYLAETPRDWASSRDAESRVEQLCPQIFMMSVLFNPMVEAGLEANVATPP